MAKVKDTEVNLNLDDIAKKIVHWNRFNRYLVLEMLDVVNNSYKKNVLELGCGSGVTTKILLENFKQVTIVDGSDEYLTQNKKHNNGYTNSTYIHSNFEDLGLTKKFEDIVLAHILEHVEDPINILKLSKKWANKDTLFHIIVPNGFSFHRRIGVELGMMEAPNDLPQAEADTGHRRVYDVEMLTAHIQASGLKIKNVTGCNLKLFTHSVLQVINQDYIDAIYKVSKQIDPSVCADLYITCSL